MTDDRDQTAKSRQARANRPPRRLRRQVEKCLRKATITKVQMVAIRENGSLEFVSDATPASSSPKGLYLWRASLPGGHVVACLTDRPIRMDEQPFFPLLVDSLANAIHRGVGFGGIKVQRSPERMRATAIDGEAGWDASVRRLIAESMLAGLPVLFELQAGSKSLDTCAPKGGRAEQ